MSGSTGASLEKFAFQEKLAHYGRLTAETLNEHLPAGEPYQYLYGPVRDFIGSSGKGFRPALLISTCRAFGGRIEDALISAAALELLHNAFLIHDDIEDESDFRRGRPCLHHRTGVPLAINTGDAMQALALRFLRQNAHDLGPETTARIIDEFDHLLMQALEGQAMELGWIRDNETAIDPSDYLRMSLKKTCWYSFIHPCRIGALIARPDDVASGAFDLDRFNAIGFYMGAAFQIQDDVLNLIGSEAKYGKEIGGDIYEGKRTLMLARLFQLSTGREHREISATLNKPRSARTGKDVVRLTDLMHQYKCIEFAQAAAQDLIGAAKDEMGRAFADADPEEITFVDSFIDYLTTRNV